MFCSRASLCLMIAMFFWSSATFGEVSVSCNKKALKHGIFWDLVKRDTIPINESYVLVNLTRADVAAAIQKKAPSAEVLSGICAYYEFNDSEEKLSSVDLHLTGEISMGDLSSMADSMRGIEDARTESKPNGAISVVLDSEGGDVIASMKIGRLLANHKNINTSVQPKAVCISACVLILAAGDSKSIFGKVGIHRIRFTDRKTTSLSKDNYRKAYDTTMQEVRGYLQEMGVRPSLADDMMRYSSDNIHFLTKENIAHYYLDQRNLYAFEQEKSQLIARCGEKWYAVSLSLQELVNQKCAGFGTSDKVYSCIESIYKPHYDMCR